VDIDAFSLGKQFIHVGDSRVAYRDDGAGPPVLLLHGCPFSSFVWRKIIPGLTDQFRCLTPDLLGLGDTETPPDTDWSLPAQEQMILGLLDTLGVERVHMVGHDHGGAIAQLVAARHADRIDRLVLCNVEAYDNWPSADERPLVQLTQVPVIGSLVLKAYGTRPVHRLLLSLGHATHDRAVLDDELIDGYIRANASDSHRQAKTARFLAGQLEPDNNKWTLAAVEGLKQFDHPTLLLWGAADPHFGPRWAERLRDDIPGPVAVELLADTGRLVMAERPDDVIAHLRAFLGADVTASTSDRA
jgi:pimeloyl-ACP methyl ester carboxylesterase